MEHGHLFVVWDAAAADFIDKCFASIAPLKPHYSITDAAGLRTWLQTGKEDPATYYANLQRHRLLMQIDPEYYTQIHLRLKNR